MRTFKRAFACVCALCACLLAGCMAREAALTSGSGSVASAEGRTPAGVMPEASSVSTPAAATATAAATTRPAPSDTPAPTPMPIIEKWGMVDVRAYIPGVVVDMRYATEDNFMGRAVYESDMCLLARGTADRLKAAQAICAADGLSIKVYDAYRPLSVQQILWDMAADKSFVANPKTGSRHNRGAAVDITLVDEAGEELIMPSAYDEATYRARRDYKGIDPAAKENAAYLTEVMVKCGFITISNEWWHYDDKDYKKYPLADHDAAAFYDEDGE